ncbi:hypothetical protein PoB_006191900 [Plakobranchus ocellatus]|uniref:Uncharacterized protein n=1 Tax=Plakobranchus ocellatus TaxID=259542 RepID=A0AAV4CU59_9GAST|nr:hypothetical protein PoB_006191900 [Plakobranchus ocellatus]
MIHHLIDTENLLFSITLHIISKQTTRFIRSTQTAARTLLPDSCPTNSGRVHLAVGRKGAWQDCSTASLFSLSWSLCTQGCLNTPQNDDRLNVNVQINNFTCTIKLRAFFVDSHELEKSNVVNA